MKKGIENQISYSQTRMAQEVMRMQVLFQNLCVKAEPVALLGVEVQACGAIMKIEQCADVVIPEWNKFQMFIKNPDDIDAVAQAVLRQHPEFIEDRQPAMGYEGQTAPESTLIFTMPPVDKARREYLLAEVARLYALTDGNVLSIKQGTLSSISVALMTTPDDIQEASDALDQACDTIKANMLKAREAKEQEIEDAYRKYQEEHSEELAEEQQPEEETDISQSMEMPQMPEVPAVPEVPEMPQMPEMPQAPEMPAVPEMPEMPQAPEMPEVPEMPELPETPEVPSWKE